MNSHLKRWLTGITALPVVIYLTGFSPEWVFILFLFLFSVTGLIEFYRIVSPDLPPVIKVFNCLITLLFFLAVSIGRLPAALFLTVIWMLVPMICSLFSANPVKGEIINRNIAGAASGPFYVVIPLVMMIPLASVDMLNSGGYSIRGIWIFFLLTVTFANDTGAFYCGRIFGKHKLYKAVSPNKTWEGSIGGLFFSVVAGIIFLVILGPEPVSLVKILLISALSIAGQIGDLAESMLKRNHGVKDSGGILPGHGGVLDRIDSLLFSVPVLYIYFFFNSEHLPMLNFC